MYRRNVSQQNKGMYLNVYDKPRANILNGEGSDISITAVWDTPFVPTFNLQPVKRP